LAAPYYINGSVIYMTAQPVVHGSAGDPGQRVWPHCGVWCSELYWGRVCQIGLISWMHTF